MATVPVGMPGVHVPPPPSTPALAEAREVALAKDDPNVLPEALGVGLDPAEALLRALAPGVGVDLALTEACALNTALAVPGAVALVPGEAVGAATLGVGLSTEEEGDPVGPWRVGVTLPLTPQLTVWGGESDGAAPLGVTVALGVSVAAAALPLPAPLTLTGGVALGCQALPLALEEGVEGALGDTVGHMGVELPPGPLLRLYGSVPVEQAEKDGRLVRSGDSVDAALLLGSRGVPVGVEPSVQVLEGEGMLA